MYVGCLCSEIVIQYALSGVVAIVCIIPGNTKCSAENTINRAKTDTTATQV